MTLPEDQINPVILDRARRGMSPDVIAQFIFLDWHYMLADGSAASEDTSVLQGMVAQAIEAERAMREPT